MPDDFGADADDPRVSLTTAELAAPSHAGSKTVSRWAQAGSLRASMKPGGHRRLDQGTGRALLVYVPTQPPAD